MKRYVGERIELIQTIGAGGCASVWLGRHRETGALVAAKLVHGDGEHEELALRFQREAEMSARLTHRNLVRVHDFFREADGQPVLLMEYLRGQTLEDLENECGPMDPLAAVSILAPVLRGLEHAHERGVIHRDLKPSNIFLAVESDGVVIPKLLDFGIARTTDTQSISLTLQGQVLGSPAYMSPEQVRGLTVSETSDVFSVGVVLYEMLTGDLAFRASSAHAAMAAVLERVVAPHPLIPAPVWSVIDRALTKDSTARYASVAELRVALEEAVEYTEMRGADALAGLGLVLPPLPQLPPMPPPSARTSRPSIPASLVATQPAIAIDAAAAAPRPGSSGEYDLATATDLPKLPVSRPRWLYATGIAASFLVLAAGTQLLGQPRAEASPPVRVSAAAPPPAPVVAAPPAVTPPAPQEKPATKSAHKKPVSSKPVARTPGF